MNKLNAHLEAERYRLWRGMRSANPVVLGAIGGPTLELPEPPAPEATGESKRLIDTMLSRERGFGADKGQICVADDFDDELDDFKEYP